MNQNHAARARRRQTLANTRSPPNPALPCVLDTDQYPTGTKYTKKDVDALPITRHDFHGEWNYCV